MKRSIYLSGLILAFTQVRGQTPVDDPRLPSLWKNSMQTGINYNQASFSDNWKGGGVNTVSWNAFFNAKADYQNGDFGWGNDLQLQYGQTNTKDVGYRKSLDRIFYESKLSNKLSPVWNLFGALSFQSQFGDGFDYQKKGDGSDSVSFISAALSPAYVTEALGLEYKPVPYFSAQFGFVSFRQSIVMNQDLYRYAPTVYGVDKGEYVRNQFIFQFIASFDKEIFKNVTLKARFMQLQDYQQFDKKGMVSRLDANLVAKINRFLNVSLGTVVLYDYDQVDRIQYSQVMGLGLLYTLSNYQPN
ncbi:MAG: DUF3078 domain-containing protein [Bacteroidia bacterium]|jgi:hypothetical protein